MVCLSLIQNIGLLVSLTFVHSLLVRRLKRDGVVYPLLSGLLFGGVCMIGMMTPVTLQPGLIFDGRSIILGVAGLFGGPVVALIAATIAAAYRLWLSGIGALPGIWVIISSAAFGVLWHFLRRRRQWLMYPVALLSFGLLIHLLMLTILLLTLPETAAHVVLNNVALPLLLIYPPTTLLVCLLFVLMEQHLQGEEKLRQNEERMRLFFERQLVGMAITSPEKGWVQVNDKLCQMFGYNREELKTLSWADLTHPDDLAKDLAKFNRLLSGKIDDYLIEKRFINKSGSIVHTNLSVGCVRKSDGSVDYVLAHFEDITEHHLALEAITREKETAQRYLDIAGAMLCALNRTGEIILINKKGSQILGYHDEELLGQNWFDVCLPESVRNKVKGLFDLQLAGDLAPFEYYENCIINRSGEERLISFHNTLLHDEDGISGVLFSGEDITDRHNMQEELLKSQKLESLGVLAGGIAHDFNNILTGIMGNISFAGMSLATPDKAQKLLENAEKASMRAASLATQLLTFAKGGKPIKKTVSVGPLLKESLSLSLRGANVKGVLEIPENLHTIEADEGQISQVFNNLIINALQAMPGGGSLTIKAENTTLDNQNSSLLPPGVYVSISFIDQGCGISEEDQKKIFDPYFTTKVAGSGLGLASSYSIISKHGGRIDVCSVVGNGATFTVHLPSLGTSKEDQYSSNESSTLDGHETGAILILDDEQIILDLTTDVLEYLGYQVSTCVDGEDAIKMYKAAKESGTPFLAAIMDLTIPGGMGGSQAAEQILQYDPLALLLVSSGYSNDPVIADYRSYGFSGAITKPYKVEDISSVLDGLTNRLQVSR